MFLPLPLACRGWHIAPWLGMLTRKSCPAPLQRKALQEMHKPWRRSKWEKQRQGVKGGKGRAVTGGFSTGNVELETVTSVSECLVEGWETGKNTSCSCRRPRSSSQHPHGCSQLPITPVPGDANPLLYVVHVSSLSYTHFQKKKKRWGERKLSGL